ncbi:MAG: hypothetical protein AW07_03477 [Candidatus Accumulibacter sp. SK-11]|nr:MAG: hypothetical protein AW07_03477 [Candidatus Accumulibacter sp. SK-11]
MYYEDARIAYYAGRGYPVSPLTGEQLMAADPPPGFRYYLFTHKPDDDKLQRWLATQQKQVIRRFANRKGETILVIGE